MTENLVLPLRLNNKLNPAGILLLVSGLILTGLISPAWAGDTSTTRLRRRAGINFGPVNAVEEKVDELDEKANDYWTALWEDNGCTGDETAVNNCGIDFPQKVLNYWAHHEAEQPDKFGVSVTPTATTSSDDSDTVAGTKSATGSWPVETGGAVSASPAVADDGSIYVGSNDGNLYAYNETGDNQLWSLPTGGDIDATPAMNNDGKIFFGDLTGSFYAVDNSSGDTLWEKETGAWIVGSAAISKNNSIFVGNTAGEIYSFSSGGATNWNRQPGGKITGSPAVRNNSTLYLGTWDGSLYAMDTVGGTVNWSFSTNGKIKSSPALRSDSTIYVTSLDGYVYALKDLGNSYKLSWKKQLGDSITASPAIGSDSDIYVGDWSGKMYSLQAGGGTVNWTFNTTKRITSSAAVGDNGNVYFGAANGNLYGLDKQGSGLWKLETGNAVSSSPALANNKIYCGSNDKKIYGASVDPTGLYPSDWPKYRAANKNYAGLEAPAPEIHTGPAWYVNDTATANGDIHTSAIGQNTNTGGPDDPFRTFEKALKTAESGETIYIDGGTFSETAVLRKNDLAVIGAGAETTSFDYGDSTPATGAVALRADTPDNIRISKLGVSNYFRGIEFNGGTNHRIENVRIENSDTPILLASTTDNLRLSQATLSNNTHGLIVDGCSNCRITNNRFAQNNSNGIKILNGSNNLIAANELQNNSNYQLYYSNTSQSDKITKNNISVGGDSGIRDATANHDFRKNWWDTTAKDAVAAKITGSDSYLPYRLGKVDTSPGADTVAPARVQIDTAISGSYEVEIRWQEVTADEDGSSLDFDHYRIYRTTVQGETDWKSNSTVVDTVSGSGQTNWTDNSVDNGDTYYYRITAVDGSTPENEAYFSDTAAAYPAHQQAPWYVNDTATVNDIYTYDTGSNSNTGGSTDPFRTITKALEVATAGETIYVDAGTYGETVSIDTKNLTLVGADSEFTVVDGQAADCLEAQSLSGITLRKFKIINSNYGLNFDLVDNSTVKNISVVGADASGFLLQNSTQNYFSNNFSGTSGANGFYLSDADTNNFTNNHVQNNSGRGVYLDSNSQNNEFNNNHFRENTGAGLVSLNSPGGRLNKNNIEGNGEIGIKLKGSSNWKITSNLIKGNQDTGIILVDSNEDKIYQNTISNNESYQLAVKGTSSNLFFEANNLNTSPVAPQEMIYTTITSETTDLRRNWWSNTDIQTINNTFGGTGADSISYVPFRLGIADTTSTGDTIAPAAPQNFASDTDNFSANLSWDAVDKNQNGQFYSGERDYRIYRMTSTPESDWKSNGDTLTELEDATNYQDSAVLNGTTYYYRMTAFDNHNPENESWFSDTATAPIPAVNLYSETYITQSDSITVRDTISPAMPGDTVTFTVNSSHGGETVVQTYSNLAADSGWADTHLVLSDSITRVRAKIYDKDYGVLYDTALSVVYYDTQPPDTPAHFSPKDGAETTSTEITFQWAKPADTVVTDELSNADLTYRLQVDTEANFDTPWVRNAGNISGTSTSETFPADGKTYYWRLLAKDAAGNTSPYSPADSFSVVVEIDSSTVSVGDGADTLYYADLEGDSALRGDSDQQVGVEAYNADTVALYFNRRGIPASASSDTRVSMANLAADSWSGIIADTQTSGGDTINFILEGINTAGDTTIEDNGGQGFEYRVHSNTEFNTASISVGDGADTLYYADLDGDSALSADSNQQVGVEAYNAETVALYFNRSGTPARTTSDTRVYLANVAADSWSGIITDTQTSGGDTINFILEGINRAGDTTIEDSGGAGFEYRVNDAGEVKDYLRSIWQQHKEYRGGSLTGGSTTAVQQFHYTLAQRGFKQNPVVVGDNFFNPGLGVSNRSGSEAITTVEHVKIVG